MMLVFSACLPTKHCVKGACLPVPLLACLRACMRAVDVCGVVVDGIQMCINAEHKGHAPSFDGRHLCLPNDCGAGW
jgi:hypothetical protein